MEMDALSDEKLIELFIDDCSIRNFSKHTLESYKSTMKLFLNFIKNNKKRLTEVDKTLFKKYISYLVNEGIHYKTIENRFSTLSTFYDYLVYEEILDKNIVISIRKRYIRRYKKNNNNGSKRKLIDVETMAFFIHMIFDTQMRAIAILFAKTGIRLRELIDIDVDDIDWSDMSIKLKPKPKRSNLIVFFDNECAFILKRWLEQRKTIAKKNCKALFVSYETGKRIHRNTVYNGFTKWAEKAGIHDPKSDKLEDHYTPHCARHWNTTMLMRSGLSREFLKHLRGDKQNEALDLYYHIDMQELRRAYLAHIPQLGVI